MIQHQTSIILVCVVMGVFMAFGAGGLLITQHIGVIYVSLFGLFGCFSVITSILYQLSFA